MGEDLFLPELNMVWPTVYANHPDEAPLDVLQNIIGGGQTSLLYKNLQKPGLAVAAVNFHNCREIHCSFHILVRPNPRRVDGLAEIETIVRESLVEFEGRGVEDDDLTRVKSSIISSLIYGLESVSGKMSQLAAYETYRDNPNGIGDDIARYESVTKADVMRVYNQYIKDKPAVIMSIVPKGQPFPIHLASQKTLAGRAQRTQKVSTVPKSRRLVQITLPLKPPIHINFRLATALRCSAPEIPKFRQRRLIYGLSQVRAMRRSTSLAWEELSNELDKLGSSVSFSSGDTFSTMSIRTLTKNLDATIAIAMEKLLTPSFEEADFERDKANTLQGIKASKKNALRTSHWKM